MRASKDGATGAWSKTLAPPRLTYHEISEATPKYLYSVSTAQFLAHVRCVQESVRSLNLRERVCPITFDDGHVSQYIHSLPILQDEGARATFFITAGWTNTRAGYMSWRQLAELVRCGHEVQSHGWSHEFLTQCSTQSLKEELVRSKMELEDHLGVKVDAISAPGGRWNDKVLESCADAGYKFFFTSDPWMTREEHFGMKVSGRWMVTRKMTAADIRARLLKAGPRLYLLRADRLAKSVARMLLGDHGYQMMWRALANKNKSMETQEDQVICEPGMKT
jgi:peptidoglycan/xylan/chitin deacetylase (PgdA/CDA1 family)